MACPEPLEGSPSSDVGTWMHVSQIRRLPDSRAQETGGLLNRPEDPV